ncbi:MAG: hypothetical protein A4E38_01846 [Methanoregulaceae archaeon PtaB.Bin108]|jgi:hypothetical protein|nr:MAG: hypothetical protein A4E38_01846 [Methanoregulaceae archaeon PtaB.Bin108]
MTPDPLITVPEIQVLLNLLKKPVEIKYPLYDFDIMTLRDTASGFVLSGMCTREDFGEASGAFGEFAHDMPSYNDVLQSMLASGIIAYPNMERFRDIVNSIPLMNKEVVFSLDTNMLYHAFPSRGCILSSDYVLVDIVQAEIESALNTKYSPHTINQMKRMAPFEGALLEELVNQKTKRSRIAAYTALAEFEKIRSRSQVIPGIEQGGPDKEKNDLIIVRTLKDYEKSAFCIMVLLTADANVAELCRAEGIAYHLFEFPHAIDVRECTPSQAVDLISHLAVAFGVVKCGSAFIYGEYRGKGAKKQSMKVVIRNPDLAEEFERELTLCRTLEALPIGG